MGALPWSLFSRDASTGGALTARRSTTTFDRIRSKGSVPKEIESIAGRAPRGLSVDRLEIGSDELAVFQWDIADLAAERAAATLTAAERAVLDLVVSGASNAEIARTRGSSVRTVANQVASLLRKLAATSRFELVRRYGRSCASRHAT